MNTLRLILSVVLAATTFAVAAYGGTITVASPDSTKKPQAPLVAPVTATPKAPGAGTPQLDTKVSVGPAGADRKSPAPVPPPNINKNVLPGTSAAGSGTTSPLLLRNTKTSVPIGAVGTVRNGAPVAGKLLDTRTTKAKGAAPGGKKTTIVKPRTFNQGGSSEDLMSDFMKLQTVDPTHPYVEIIQTKVFLWQDLISSWNFFQTKFTLHLNNRGSGSEYVNNSFVEIDGHRHALSLPLIQYDKNALHHRCLIYNMDAPAGNITLTKKGSVHFTVIIPFESNGVEIKRFNKSLSSLQKHWCDGCEADRDLTNPTLEISLTFVTDSQLNNPNLDFSVEARFNAGVQTTSGEMFVTWLDNIGITSAISSTSTTSDDPYNDPVTAEIAQEGGGVPGYYQAVFQNIGNAVLNLFQQGDKNRMLSSLRSFIRTRTGLTHGEQIKNYKFNPDGIVISYEE